MLDLLLTNPILFLLWAIGLITAITIHEFSHALAADRLGDPTPRLMGRLTLNPLAHLDPVGTIMILITRFGWGKPVPFDPFNLENPKRDSALIALAGPVSNFITAIILSLIIRFAPMVNENLSLLSSLLLPIVFLNVMLAVFNLVPVHPLDGGKILIALLPPDLSDEAEDIMNRYGTIILILLIFPFSGTSPISTLLSPAIQFILSLLLP